MSLISEYSEVFGLNVIHDGASICTSKINGIPPLIEVSREGEVHFVSKE